MSDPPLIGRGRAADVFDLGGERVLRRYRLAHPGSVEAEAAAMQHLRAHGAPVPEVFSAEGDEMVMERLDGPTMLQALTSKPWRAKAVGRELFSLHQRIHRIPAGDLPLRRFSEGDSILHFDLHPDNVILTANGPVIIDWSNVRLGDPLADVMNSWMLMSIGSPDGVPTLLRPVLTRVRRALTTGFIESTPLDTEARRWLRRVCELRLQDPNTRPEEAERVRALAASHGRD